MAGPVLILCATRLEMGAFLDRHLFRREEDAVRNLKIVTSTDQSWVLALSGPGAFNAAVALTACLERFRPEFILHTGIAGVFPGNRLDPGDAAVAVTDTYIHTGVDDGRLGMGDSDETGFGATQHDPGGPASRSGQRPLALSIRSSILLTPLPFDLIPGKADTRRGIYQMDTGLAASCHRHLIRSLTCRVAKGPFVTVSAITGSFEKADALSDTFSPVMESMEGAAVAHVASLYQIPMVQVRAVSNQVGDRDKNRWDIPAAVQTVADICDTLLEKAADHDI